MYKDICVEILTNIYFDCTQYYMELDRSTQFIGSVSPTACWALHNRISENCLSEIENKYGLGLAIPRLLGYGKQTWDDYACFYGVDYDLMSNAVITYADIMIALKDSDIFAEIKEYAVLTNALLAMKLYYSRAYDELEIMKNNYQDAIENYLMSEQPAWGKEAVSCALWFLDEDNLEDAITAKTRNRDKEIYRSKGVCQYCGGAFKGLFNKTCTRCGHPKDY